MNEPTCLEEEVGPIDQYPVEITAFEYVDPIVDAYFAHCGKTSRRRFMNIVRMRYKAMLIRSAVQPDEAKLVSSRLSVSDVSEYVRTALQPSWSFSVPSAGQQNPDASTAASADLRESE